MFPPQDMSPEPSAPFHDDPAFLVDAAVVAVVAVAARQAVFVRVRPPTATLWP
jgi:hypothetical protein